MKSLKKFINEAEKHVEDMDKLSEIIGEIANGDFPEEYYLFACELCDLLLGRNASDHKTRYRRGYLLFKANNFEEAAEEFTYVINNDPKRSSAVLYDRARAYYQNGLFEESLADIERILSEDKQFFEEGFSLDILHVLRGMIFIKTDKTDLAIEEFEKAEQYAPDDENITKMVESAIYELNQKNVFLTLKKLLRKDETESFKEVFGSLNNPDYSIISEKGMSLLHNAAEIGNSELAMFLLDNGADPDSLSDENLCPVHIAALHDKNEIILILFKKGANMYMPSSIEGGSLLNYLIIHKRLDDLCALVAEGADINRIIPGVPAPLHTAVSSNNLDAVKKLIELGADVNIEDSDGVTPFDIAIDNGFIKIEDLFRELL
ncbi:MAG: ankyrin repeat domain-containing protein [Spirochaetes bacterium]|nr:ankyrin repeat domain-containing protein [Spirochaetota bacterium]MBN2771986.1 ankyrin repeat domain-containing protein [Spirochaetota bacterium]